MRSCIFDFDTYTHTLPSTDAKSYTPKFKILKVVEFVGSNKQLLAWRNSQKVSRYSFIKYILLPFFLLGFEFTVVKIGGIVNIFVAACIFQFEIYETTCYIP
jgi:hypothetical protein